jgi:hypothetical protein
VSDPQGEIEVCGGDDSLERPICRGFNDLVATGKLCKSMVLMAEGARDECILKDHLRHTATFADRIEVAETQDRFLCHAGSR